jgi:hypothetical protein
MKFKNTKKSDTPEEVISKGETKDILLKDEIKEIVEETVEEMMKVKSKKEKSIPAEVLPGEADVTEEMNKDSNEEEKLTTSEVLSAEATVPEETVEESKEEEKISDDNEAASDTTSTPGLVIHPSPVESQASEEPTVEETRQEMVQPSTSMEPVSQVTPMEPVMTVSDSVEVSTKRSRLPLLLGFLIALLLMGGGGYWYLSSHTVPSLSFPGSPLGQKITPSKAPSVSVTQTPKEVDLTKYTVSVLNGSGVSGAATKVKTTLTDAGFKITSTGNANSSDVVDTYISAKTSVDEAFLKKLSDTVSKTYKVSSETHKLDSSVTEDVTVTIGSSTK